jgi:hypothetical protein
MHYHLEERSETKPWLTIEFEESSNSNPHPLSFGLQQRHTDRRRYGGGSINDQVFKELKQHSLNSYANDNVNLYFTNNYPSEYLAALAGADESLWITKDILHEFNRWIRFTDRHTISSKDGLPWRSLLREPETTLHYLQSRLWWFSALLNFYPQKSPAMIQKMYGDYFHPTPKSYDDGAALACVTVNSGSRESLITAGKLILETWIRLNQAGYSVQPLTNLVYLTWLRRLGISDLPESDRHLIKNDYESSKKAYGFSESEIPVFVFRTGLPITPYPLNAKTLRREDRLVFHNQ